MPVTRPAFDTVAIAVLLLDHVPAVEGVTLAVFPTQTVVAPPKVGLAGIPLMVTLAELPETHVFELVTINVYDVLMGSPVTV